MSEHDGADSLVRSDALLVEIRAERARWERTQTLYWGTKQTYIYYIASGTVTGLYMAEQMILEAMQANATGERPETRSERTQ